MAHITIGGWEYRDGHACDGLKLDNERRFSYVVAKMRQGVSEIDADAMYEADHPEPRDGQRNCVTCGQWSCSAPHDMG